MKKENKDGVPDDLKVKALAQVKYATSALAQWERMSQLYSEDLPRRPQSVRDAFVEVRNWLIEKELAAYRNLFLTVSIWGDTEDTAAKRLAIKRFLQEDMTISHIWSDTGEFPCKWLIEDENLIRACVAEVEQELTGKRKYNRRKERSKNVNKNNTKVRE